MTLEQHWCPVEGCEFGVGQDRSLRSVRSHINAETSESHDWNALRDQVHDQEQGEPAGEQGEASEFSPSEESETSPEGAATDGSKRDEAESNGEQTEGAENAPSEQPESGSEMATQDEYEAQQQRQQQNSGTKGGSEGEPSGDSASGGGPPATADKSHAKAGGSAGFHVPDVGTSTLLVLGALTLAAFVVWRLVRDDSTDHTPPEEDADPDEDASSETEPMVDVEAGTGGVSV